VGDAPRGAKASPKATARGTVAPAARPPSRDQGPGNPTAPAWLPYVGVVVALWAALPHFLTPHLNTKDSAEVVDHLIPGVVVLAVCATVLLLRNRPAADTAGFLAGLVLLLAGLWMAATHVPLLAQATRGEAPWPGTIHHTASAAAVLAFSVVWIALNWGSGLPAGD
jgi:hypothetical protein